MVAVRKVNSNSRVVHQPSQPYGSNTQFEQGRRECEFEPFAKNEKVETKNGEVDTKNKKTHNTRTTVKEKTEPAKKFSNHIEFIDYIPTHEVITYHHLFAYGFYVE